MKILQVINSLGTGGAEKLLLDTIPMYNAQGVKMDVLLLWDNDLPFTLALKNNKCCKVHILKQSSNFKDIYNPAHILKIRKILKAYDIIHVHLFPAQYFVALANIGVNKKLIFTEHSTSNSRVNNPIFKFIEKWCYSRYSKIIAISQDVFNIYEHYLNKTENLVLINNGVGISAISNALPIDKNEIHPLIFPDDILIMQVSAFRAPKDQSTLIRALQYLPNLYKVLLVGTGERQQVLIDLVAELHFNDRVLFLGQRMDVPRLLKSADIIVLSSQYEGLSLSSVEGLASGKPFIASEVPGLREIVEDAGVLFPFGDEKKLAEIILELSNNPQFANDVSTKSMKRAKLYDIKEMVSKHVQLYKDVYEKD